MISTSPHPAERRNYERIELAAMAHVITGDRCLGPFLVENVSGGGALLVGDPKIDIGDHVILLMHIPGGKPIRIGAEIVRCQRDPHGEAGFAISFRNSNPDAQDELQDAVLAKLERRKSGPVPTVLIVDDSHESREALERELQALGRETIAVATPLDAVQWLQLSGVQFEAVFVDTLHPSTAGGIDMLAFLSEEYPEVHRVLMSSGARRSQLMLAVTQGRAHAVLQKPFHKDTIQHALEERPQH